MRVDGRAHQCESWNVELLGIIRLSAPCAPATARVTPACTRRASHMSAEVALPRALTNRISTAWASSAEFASVCTWRSRVGDRCSVRVGKAVSGAAHSNATAVSLMRVSRDGKGAGQRRCAHSGHDRLCHDRVEVERFEPGLERPSRDVDRRLELRDHFLACHDGSR